MTRFFHRRKQKFQGNNNTTRRQKKQNKTRARFVPYCVLFPPDPRLASYPFQVCFPLHKPA